MNVGSAADTAWWQAAGTAPNGARVKVRRTSCYLTMRDGVKIAVDLYLPHQLSPSARLPTILHQTRYYRRTSYHWPFNLFMERTDMMLPYFRRFVGGGYAVVNVDVRGTGASFGSRQMEWSPDEVKDGAEVIDWIIRQPWSDGQVATMGISYTGTAAEMALRNGHPALKAAVIQYGLFDIYPDILAPGGVFNEYFMRTWSQFNAVLDKNEMSAFAGRYWGRVAGLAIKGVPPVDADRSAALLAEAVKGHADNYGIFSASLEVECRDDRTNSGIALDDFSPHAFLDEIVAAGAPVYSWSGWYDGAYTLAAITRFLNVKTPGTRLILGPWDHGGRQNPDPFVPDHVSRFDRAGEILRFLDHHLKGVPTGIEREPPIHYFTMGEEAWKTADTWPPPGFTPASFYLAEGRALEQVPPQAAAAGSDRYRADTSAGSSTGSRWLSQVNIRQIPIRYPDRKERDAKLLAYTSAPLAQDAEVTGTPVVTLFIRANAPDVQVFAYLEDVGPDGEVFYVTEGALRGLHRRLGAGSPPYRMDAPYHSFKRADALPLAPGEIAELTFHLQPVSYLFRRGHAIRVALACADREVFALVPAEPPEIEVLHDAVHPSRVVLPLRGQISLLTVAE